MNKEGTDLPRATRPLLRHTPREGGTYQCRKTLRLGRVPEEPTEVGVGFGIWEEGKNLN
jgi:hypothetical protein